MKIWYNMMKTYFWDTKQYIENKSLCYYNWLNDIKR